MYFQRLHWKLHQAELTQAELTQGRLDSRADLTSGRVDPLPSYQRRIIPRRTRMLTGENNKYINDPYLDILGFFIVCRWLHHKFGGNTLL